MPLLPRRASPSPHPKKSPITLGFCQIRAQASRFRLRNPKGPLQHRRTLKTPRALRKKVNNLSSGEEDGKVAPNLGDSTQSLQLLRLMNQALQALWEEYRLLQEENRALHVLLEEYRIFQEENKAPQENNRHSD